MASYTIPEEVIGIPLFVPDANDYFEIVAGGMPNGDDSLRVRGDLSSDYKAFMPAPATTPPLNQQGQDWSLNFWIKAPSTGGSANNAGTSGTPYATVILCMMNSLQSSTSLSANAMWGVAADSTAGNLLFMRAVASGSAGFIVALEGNVRDSTWHMVTYMPGDGSGAPTAYMYKDEDVSPLASDTASSQNQSVSNAFLCIGTYSDLGPTAFAEDYQLGKISFHDHQLNQTERSLLYNAMTT